MKSRKKEIHKELRISNMQFILGDPIIQLTKLLWIILSGYWLWKYITKDQKKTIEKQRLYEERIKELEEQQNKKP